MPLCFFGLRALDARAHKKQTKRTYALSKDIHLSHMTPSVGPLWGAGKGTAVAP